MLKNISNKISQTFKFYNDSERFLFNLNVINKYGIYMRDRMEKRRNLNKGLLMIMI